MVQGAPAPGAADERRPAGLRPARPALRPRADRVRREPDLRPAAEDPARGRDVDRPAADGRAGPRARRRSRTASASSRGPPSSTRSRRSRTRAAARSPRSAAARSPGSHRGRECSILEDDPYGLVRFEGESPPAIFDLARETTIYTSSFSKTIAPGLRVGWYILPSDLAGPLIERANGTYITPVLLGQATVYEFIRRGSFEPNLDPCQGAARGTARRDARRARQALRRRRVVAARGRLLHLARAARRHERQGGARAGRGRHGGARNRLRRRRQHASASRTATSPPTRSTRAIARLAAAPC